ncbi:MULTISPECIES: hypothetical protein [unclassified Cedecea]|uniref:hypothetical protein n=1 Tax=unclassified Cedecea TaxID=2649846 RepID=UPI003018554F|nr:hypothetical protein [Enterobacter sp. Ap-867]
MNKFTANVMAMKFCSPKVGAAGKTENIAGSPLWVRPRKTRGVQFKQRFFDFFVWVQNIAGQAINRVIRILINAL